MLIVARADEVFLLPMAQSAGSGREPSTGLRFLQASSQNSGMPPEWQEPTGERAPRTIRHSADQPTFPD
jgi:hypothetical protein